MVRGLDYYEKTVFEWVSDKLGAQNAICAGGRFDGLVEQLGGPATCAAGFAIGLERVIALMQDDGRQVDSNTPDVYLVMVGDAAIQQGHLLAESLRDELPRLALRVNCGGGNFKNQLKRADRSGARLALILGEEEAGSGQITIKQLRVEQPQHTISQSSLKDFLDKTLF